MTIVLNDLFVMTLGLLIIFVLYDWNTSYKLKHIWRFLLVKRTIKNRTFLHLHEAYQLKNGEINSIKLQASKTLPCSDSLFWYNGDLHFL